jgi:hypothetical protein
LAHSHLIARVLDVGNRGKSWTREVASVEEFSLPEEVVQGDAVELAQGGQFDDVKAPLAGLDLADEGGVSPQAAGDVLLLQAVLKKQIAQRQKAAKALIKAKKPKRAIRPNAKAQPLVAPPPKVPPLPVAQIAVREKGKAAPALNTTCDIYHSGNTPPAADVAGVPCTLVARFREGGEASEGDSTFRKVWEA